MVRKIELIQDSDKFVEIEGGYLFVKKDEIKVGFGVWKRRIGRFVGDDVGEDEVKVVDFKGVFIKILLQIEEQLSLEVKDKKLKKKVKKIKFSFDEGDQMSLYYIRKFNYDILLV